MLFLINSIHRLITKMVYIRNKNGTMPQESRFTVTAHDMLHI